MSDQTRELQDYPHVVSSSFTPSFGLVTIRIKHLRTLLGSSYHQRGYPSMPRHNFPFNIIYVVRVFVHLSNQDLHPSTLSFGQTIPSMLSGLEPDVGTKKAVENGAKDSRRSGRGEDYAQRSLHPRVSSILESVFALDGVSSFEPPNYSCCIFLAPPSSPFGFVTYSSSVNPSLTGSSSKMRVSSWNAVWKEGDVLERTRSGTWSTAGVFCLAMEVWSVVRSYELKPLSLLGLTARHHPRR
ncbi:hypothetical protein GYMLUDRAFT_253283 [Collybiopsis luxurians FD-317 M1]|uniref:Uncharacterized protein n=1 Tax=Collybiopsis luxurians FD-317 M1 TaxID=944289 RepID=A0A0D0BX61_9AGAR|nr:hypothetical protein GYMLUDRAFT_253283 [Collybiopsis luxurians FD-317 M1]